MKKQTRRRGGPAAPARRGGCGGSGGRPAASSRRSGKASVGATRALCTDRECIPSGYFFEQFSKWCVGKSCRKLNQIRRRREDRVSWTRKIKPRLNCAVSRATSWTPWSRVAERPPHAFWSRPVNLRDSTSKGQSVFFNTNGVMQSKCAPSEAP